MGFSKLKIPKICEFCEKPFEAKTITTRFCSKACADKSGKRQKQLQKAAEQKQSILENSKNKIVEIQTRPYISITEATILFGISKDTLRRLIKNEIIPAHNFGQRLTRISKEHLEKMFTAVEIPKEKEAKPPAPNPTGLRNGGLLGPNRFQLVTCWSCWYPSSPLCRPLRIGSPAERSRSRTPPRPHRPPPRSPASPRLRRRWGSPT